jgi:L-lactate dehydrogenase complex protein LldG
MNSKQTILDALNRCAVPDVELPSLDEAWTTYTDARQQYRQVLEMGGGTVRDVATRDALAETLDQIEPFHVARNVWSLIPEVPSRGGDWSQITDPHELESLDFCIVPGQFAVAENGAVWVTDEDISPRAALFITQHLALVVPANQLVDNMHQAYRRVALEATRFGIFISGPSKTADIEQSLVIGAHGARSLTVLRVDDPAV